jgi:hypothetical protein
MWWAYSERFFDGVEWTLPDRLWVLDEQMASQALAVEWPSAVAIDLIGSTLFAERQARNVGNATGRSIRFISEPASTKFPDARVDEFAVADVVARAVSALGSLPGLVVRPHPTESIEAWRRWSYSRRDLGITLDQLPLEAAITDTSHAIGLSSMLLAEMAISGVRVASIQLPPAQREYFCLPFVELGITVLDTAEKVPDWVESAAANKPPRSAIFHGGAIDRATKVLIKFVNPSSRSHRGTLSHPL